MSKHAKLTKKQIDVIDDLFASELNEKEILQNHKVSRALYNKWLADENFMRDLDNRIAIAFKRSAARLAGNVSKAVEQLITLSKGDNDISRKACLDIIALQKQVLINQPQVRQETKTPEIPANTNLSDEAAGRILAALAEEK
ncbi:MAG: hypothetical protein JXA96_08290 [Sedimentisphaerales bacterium]|nr:hypothetical protein [Sedimentisphaerales bacterium]